MSVTVVCPTCRTSLTAPEDLLGQAVKCEECGSTFTARAPTRPRPESAGAGRTSGTRPRRRYEDDEDEDDRPRRPAARDEDEEEDEDDTPRRRPRAKSRRNSALPFILAGSGLVLFVLVAVAAGLYLVLGPSRAKPAAAPVAANNAVNDPGGLAPLPPPAPPRPPLQPPPPIDVMDPAAGGQNQPPAAGAQKVTLSNPRWAAGGGPGGDFEVDYQFANGQKPVRPPLSLKWRYANGTTGVAILHVTPLDGGQGTWKIRVTGLSPRRGGRAGPGQGFDMWVEEGGVGFIAGTKISNTVRLN